MASSIEFRLAQNSDIAQISLLSRNFIEAGLGWSWTPARVKRSLDSRDSNVLVACNKRRIVGFAIMHYRLVDANLDLLAICPEYRRMGIGKNLVRWLEKSAITAGIDVVYLQCRSQNLDALQFYQQLDYRVLRHLPGYYSGKESALLLGHDLLIPSQHLYLQKPYYR